MSCNAFDLYGLACGVGGRSSGYIPRDIPFAQQYAPEQKSYEPAGSYKLTHVQETNNWKPVPLYTPHTLPAARDLGFSYHPTLDIALSYLAVKSAKQEQKQEPLWKKEREELENRLAQEKVIMYDS